MLKTLEQALEDGDNINCIIRETGINQDGRSPGITMPSHQAQEALILSTYKAAGLDPSQSEDRCQFFEAHGKSDNVITEVFPDVQSDVRTDMRIRNRDSSRGSTRSRGYLESVLWQPRKGSL